MLLNESHYSAIGTSVSENYEEGVWWKIIEEAPGAGGIEGCIKNIGEPNAKRAAMEF